MVEVAIQSKHLTARQSRNSRFRSPDSCRYFLEFEKKFPAEKKEKRDYFITQINRFDAIELMQ